MPRDLVPFWIGWLPLLVFPLLSFVISGVAAQLGIAGAAWPWRRLSEGPWFERARRAYPVRFVGSLGVLIPLVAVLETWLTAQPRRLIGPPDWEVAALVGVAGYAATLLVSGRAERRILGLDRRVPGWWRRFAAYWLVLRPYVPVALPFGLLIPGRVGWPAALVVVLAGVVLYRLAAGDGLRLAARLGLAVPGPERLAAVLGRTAARMGRPAPPSLVIPSLHAGAFAMPSIGTVILTSRALETLEDAELEAVCAHELGHLSEPATVVAARSASIVWLLPFVAVKAFAGSFGWGPALIGCLLIALASRLQLGWLRRLERRADAAARAHEPAPGGYATALARLYETNLLPAVLRGKGLTHPHLFDRLVEAGVPPSYPRPSPPSALRGNAALALAVSAALAGWTGVHLARTSLSSSSLSGQAGESRLLVSLSLGGADALQLARLAVVRSERGDWTAAARLYHLASRLEPRNPYFTTMIAVALERDGRCPQAREAYAALGRAQARVMAQDAGVSEEPWLEGAPAIDPEYGGDPAVIVERQRARLRSRAAECPLLDAD